MNVRLTILVLIPACLAMVGCRQGPYLNAHIESLNAEYRALEDQYYDLEYDYQILKSDLEEHKKSEDESSADDLGFPGPGDLLEFEPPMIAPGSSSDKSLELPESSSGGGVKNATGAEPEEASDQGASVQEEIDPRVTHIFLNPKLTGGDNSDSSPGDEGLLVVIEPRNSVDQYIPLAGSISVVLLDPAENESSAKVARWDFTAQDAESSIKRSSMDKGIHLKMPWPDKAPVHSKLRLYVRYETIDGRKLQADREIFLRLPGQFSQRWTPRPAEKNDPQPPARESFADQKSDSPLRRLSDSPVIVEPGRGVDDLLPPRYQPPSALQNDPQKVASPLEKERWARERKPSARPAWSPYR